MNPRHRGVVRFFVLLGGLALHLSLPPAAWAATLVGQVTDPATGQPLQGAHISVDLAPADGVPDFEAVTGPFGFYEIGDLPPGATLQLTVTLGGYTPAEGVVVIQGDLVTENVALTRDAGPPPVDLYITVLDATSGFPIEGVPVEANRFDSANAPAPESTFNVVTDENGAAIVYGARSGFYEFTFNRGPGRRPGWEDHPKGSGTTPRTAVSSTHQINLQLKHVPQSVKLMVTGCDPATQEEGPLENVFVELTGVAPDDHGVILVSPREAPTDDKGEVTFFDLTAVHWRLRTKRYGFKQTEQFLVPVAGTDILPGSQAGGPLVVPVAIETTSLRVTLTSIYDRTDYYEALQLVLEGMEESNTAGILRLLDEGDTADERLFEKLVPGRYSLRVHDRPDIDEDAGLPIPLFVDDAVVEVDEGDETAFEFHMRVVPTRVRVRLFESLGLAEMDTGGENDLVLRRPIYQPLSVPDLRMGIADEVIELPTDENGYATFVVDPGVYGFAIPSLTEHYGAHAVVQRDGDAELELGAFEVKLRRQGWPALSGLPTPAPQSGDKGEALILDSTGEYVINLFVHPKTVTFYLPITVTGNNPTALIVQGLPPNAFVQCSPFQEILTIPPQITLTETAGGGTIAGNVLRRGPFIVAEFTDVQPGTWQWSGSHPRYDLSAVDFIPGFPGDRVTVPEWPPFPGGDHPPAPGFGLFSSYKPVIPYQYWPAGVPIIAEYKATAPVSITRMVWNEETDPPAYEEAGVIENPVFDFIRPDYAGGALFCDASRPLGDFVFWRRDPSGWFTDSVSGNGAAELTMFVGGPQDSVGNTAPQTGATVTLVAVSREAPDEVIEGIEFNLGTAGNTVRVSAGTLNVPAQYQGPLNIESIHDPTGKWTLAGKNRTRSGAFNSDVRLVAELARALRISGTVTVNNAAGEAIPHAKITLRDRFGDARFPTEETDENGMFMLPQAPEIPTFFLEVEARGFFPKRERFSGNDPRFLGGTQATLPVTIELDPIPPPIVTGEINRYGLFLSQVSVSSLGSIDDLAQAVNELTATWKGAATPPSGALTYMEPQFDQPDGTPGEMLERTLEDNIVGMAIVDPRLFPPNTSEMAGNGAVNAPESGQYNYNPDPNALHAVARQEWWNSILEHRFFDADENLLPDWHVNFRMFDLLAPGPDGGMNAEGKVELWNIPAGVYEPVIVAETEKGALGLYQIRYEGADEAKTLRSLRPPWHLSFLAEFLAMSGKFSRSANFTERVQEKTQSGRFIPKKVVKGVISLDPQPAMTPAGQAPAGFLNYEYDINTLWSEGADVPGGGFFGLVAGYAGGVVEGGYNVKLTGRNGELKYEIRGVATADKFPPAEDDPDASQREKDLVKPAALSSSDKKKVKFSSQVTGIGSLALVEKYEADLHPLESVVQTRFFFGALTEARYDLKPYAKRLPYVGPVISGLDKIDDEFAKIDLVGRFGVGVNSLSSFTTRRVRPIDATTVIVGESSQPELGHALGGLEEIPVELENEFKQETSYCFNLGLGAEIALGTVAGGSLFVSLEGKNCTIPIAGGIDRPALDVTRTNGPKWPPFTTISGAVNVTLTFFLDVWVTRFEKKFELLDAKFSHQFGTESIFTAIPMAVTFTSSSLLGESVDYRGTSPQLIGSLIGANTHAIATGGGGPDMLLFADNDPASGGMALRLAPRVDENHWAEPVNVALADAVIAADVVALPDGSYLAAWCEIAAEDLANPMASSVIRSALSSDAGATWSEPVVAAALDGVADRVFLEQAGGLTALIFCVADGGPSSNLRSVFGTAFSALDTWSAVVELVPMQEMTGFDAASCGNTVTIAFVNGDGGLMATSWRGGGPEALGAGPTGVGSSVAVFEFEGACMIASLPDSGGIQTHLYAFGIYLPLGLHFPEEDPALIRATGASGALFLVWSDSVTGALRYGLTAAIGGDPEGPFELASSFGRYVPLDLATGPAGDMTVLARYSASGADPELRQFIVSPEEGIVFDDRDADGMSDIAELRIVDANTGDEIRWIDDVLPDDDFDLDGVTNGAELDGGTDPIDSEDRPMPVGVTVVASEPEAREFGLVPGQFVIGRSDASEALEVHFSVSGTAMEEIDFTLSESSPVRFKVGVETVMVTLTPVSDSVPEGTESVILTIEPDGTYAVGVPGTATVTIADRPSDAWLVLYFPGNAADVSFTGDSDGDGINELGEFGLALDPTTPDAGGLPTYGTTDGGQFLTLTYTRPIDADLAYDVEVAMNLTGWESGPAITGVVSSMDHPDGTRTVMVRSLTPIAAVSGQQMRLKISRL